MSVRTRPWTTSKGERKEAWIVDYVDAQGERHIETFIRKKDADARHAQVRVDVEGGVHVAPSKSITIAHAADLWLERCEQGGPDTLSRSSAPPCSIIAATRSTFCRS